MSTELRSSEPRATPREWLGLAVIALPCLLYAMDLTVLNLAVPSLAATLRPSGTQLLWMLDVYGFLVAGCLVTMGTLGDRIGRRRVLLYGALAFGATSVVAAFARTPETLIAARAALGIAGATLAPSTLSLIRSMFRDPSERRFAVGVWIASYSAGTALGPLIGGIVLQRFWPGSVFLIGVPAMLLLLLTGPILLPEFKDPHPDELDLLSVGLSLAAVLLVVSGLKWLAAGDSGATPLLCILVGAIAGAFFFQRQPLLATPLVDLRLLRAPVFSAALLTYSCSSFVALGMFVYESQYLQLVLELDPLRAGLWTLPFALTIIVGSLLTPMVARRFTPSVIMPIGLAIAAAGVALLSRVQPIDGAIPVGLSMATFALGAAPVFTLSTDLMVSSAAPERAGAAAALSETGSELGAALGVAVLGSIGTFAYRHSMVDAGRSLAAAGTDAAQNTLTAALAVARGLRDPDARELADAARGAFTHSLHIAAAIAAALTLVLALVSAVVFQRALDPSRRLAPSDAS
jgi:DHA2 family multidrug resistance protein-like MFS transporter